MLKLHELQKQFVSALDNEDTSIFNIINPNGKLSAKDHLAIYQSSTFGALQKTLREIYAVCHKLVGDDFFIHMINPYIEKNMSHSPDIGRYGADFADFITTFEPANSLAYLSDVARFEWAWHKAYSAGDTPVINFEKLAEYSKMDANRIIFSLPPNSTLLFSPYPVHHIWEVNQDAFQGETTVYLEDNKKYYFFIWRKGIERCIDLLDETEWCILEYIKSGFCLGELYEKTIQTIPKLKFEEILPMMVSRGWLSGCEMDTL